MGEKQWWLYQLEEWNRTGTMARISAAQRAEQPVLVRRSNGGTSIGVIRGSGFGGRVLEVRIQTPDGYRFKTVHTDDFLELNPGFGPALREPTETTGVEASALVAPPGSEPPAGPGGEAMIGEIEQLVLSMLGDHDIERMRESGRDADDRVGVQGRKVLELLDRLKREGMHG